jgi:hypothetical protein
VHQIEAIAWDLLAAGGGANKLRNAEGLAEEFSNDVTAIENQRSVTKVSHLFEVVEMRRTARPFSASRTRK